MWILDVLFTILDLVSFWRWCDGRSTLPRTLDPTDPTYDEPGQWGSNRGKNQVSLEHTLRSLQPAQTGHAKVPVPHPQAPARTVAKPISRP